MLDFSVTFIITIFNIAVLFIILRLLLFKPVTKFMAERAKKIQDSIEQSEKDKNQAKAMLAQYEAQLKTAEAEAETILQNAREHAKDEAEKIIAKGRVSAEEVLERARKQAETERQAALVIFREEATALVIEAASRFLDREIKNEDSLSYAEMLLKEVSSLNARSETSRSETSHSEEDKD